jgi:allantoicase
MSNQFTQFPDLASRALGGNVCTANDELFAQRELPAATHLRLDVYPDGGLSRLRLFGELDAASAADTYQRWWDALPASHRSLIPRHAPR